MGSLWTLTLLPFVGSHLVLLHNGPSFRSQRPPPLTLLPLLPFMLIDITKPPSTKSKSFWSPINCSCGEGECLFHSVLSSTANFNLKNFIMVSQSVSSVAQACLTLCDPMNCSTPGLLVHHQLLESTQTHVHWVGDAIEPSHPLSSPSPPALNLSQHQGIFKWVSSLHQVAKVLEFQLQHQSFQWIFRTDFL